MKQRTLLSTFNLTIFFSLLTRITVCSMNPKFEACEPKTCGGTTNHQNVSFPFYIISKQNSYCGLPNYGLTCSHDGFPILNTSETLYTVQNIFYNNQSLRVSIPGLSGPRSTECIAPLINFSGHSKRFSVASNQKEVLLFYGCKNMQNHSIGCSAENRTGSVVALYGDDVENRKLAEKNCRGTVSVTWVKDEKGGVEEELRRGFLMNWMAKNCSECSNSGGRCGFDQDHYAFRCYCRDRIDSENCYPQPENQPVKKFKLSSPPGLTLSLTSLINGVPSWFLPLLTRQPPVLPPLKLVVLLSRLFCLSVIALSCCSILPSGESCYEERDAMKGEDFETAAESILPQWCGRRTWCGDGAATSFW